MPIYSRCWSKYFIKSVLYKFRTKSKYAQSASNMMSTVCWYTCPYAVHKEIFSDNLITCIIIVGSWISYFAQNKIYNGLRRGKHTCVSRPLSKKGLKSKIYYHFSCKYRRVEYGEKKNIRKVLKRDLDLWFFRKVFWIFQNIHLVKSKNHNTFFGYFDRIISKKKIIR